MTPIKIVFFGSTNESVIVLDKLFSSQISGQFVTVSICCIVTQPPRPIGRHQTLTPTPVEIWGKAHNIPVLSFFSSPSQPFLFADEQTVIDTLQPFKPDLLISASYGQKIPMQTINEAEYGGLNVHPSLLPRWRGADPVPWAIMNGDSQTGVTIVTLAEKFDEGKIIAQKKIPILSTDTTVILYPKLFTLGADLLVDILPDFLERNVHTRGGIASHLRIHPQGASPTPYARRLTKQDGCIKWKDLQAAEEGNGAEIVDRKFRAFHPWPGLWTEVEIRDTKNVKRKIKRRLKILALHVSPIASHLSLDTVQLEGKNPTSFSQFSSAYGLAS